MFMAADQVEFASDLCRICLYKGDYLIDNHEMIINNKPIELSKILEEFSSLEVVNDINKMPMMMCKPCAEEMGRCYMFLLKIKESDRRINMYLKLDKSDDDDDDNIENNADDDDNMIQESLECRLISNENSLSSTVDERASLEDNTEIQCTDDYMHGENNSLESEISTENYKEKSKNDVLIDKIEQLDTTLEVEEELVFKIKSEYSKDTPPEKKMKTNNIPARVYITKFVLTNPKNNLSLQKLSNQDDAVDLNSIRILDTAVVEVTQYEKIDLELDDDTNVENPNIMYMCKYCGRAYSTSHHLIMHTRKSHACQFCMKGFEKVVDLHKHIKEAHPKFHCTLCKKMFTSNSNLRQHIKKVHNIELPAHVCLIDGPNIESSIENV